MASVAGLRRAVSVVQRYYVRQVRRFTAPFDEPFYRDPLFRLGWALSALGCLAVAAVEVALGKVSGVAGVFETLSTVLLTPLVLIMRRPRHGPSAAPAH